MGVVSSFRYYARVRELVAGFPRLASIVEPLLSVRRVIRQQFAVVHKMLLDTVRGDPVCRRLMTAPGIGAVVARTSKNPVIARGNPMPLEEGMVIAMEPHVDEWHISRHHLRRSGRPPADIPAKFPPTSPA